MNGGLQAGLSGPHAGVPASTSGDLFAGRGERLPEHPLEPLADLAMAGVELLLFFQVAKEGPPLSPRCDDVEKRADHQEPRPIEPNTAGMPVALATPWTTRLNTAWRRCSARLISMPRLSDPSSSFQRRNAAGFTTSPSK